MSDDLVNLLIEFKNGNSPHPLVRIDRESAQPRYAIWQSQLDELIHEITRLTNLAQEGRKAVLQEAVDKVLINLKDLDADTETVELCAETVRALIPQEPGEKGK